MTKCTTRLVNSKPVWFAFIDNKNCWRSGKSVVSIRDVTVFESSGVAMFTITFSISEYCKVKINYATGDVTTVSSKKEKDYKFAGNIAITIPPGTLRTTISILVYNDGKPENNEYFYVNLTKLTNCILGDVRGW